MTSVYSAAYTLHPTVRLLVLKRTGAAPRRLRAQEVLARGQGMTPGTVTWGDAELQGPLLLMRHCAAKDVTDCTMRRKTYR